MLAQDADTICALSTAPGRGGISVVRVSGSLALEVVRNFCSFLPDKIKSHQVYYGFAKKKESHQSIDEVLITYFEEGRSFTSEQVVEISCHGGMYASQKILDELLKGGSRLARPGEFTYRAFMHGRIDLIQAEAVLDLVESQSEKGAQMALEQIKGEFSLYLHSIEARLTRAMAHLEANIDFANEDIVFKDNKEILKSLRVVFGEAKKLSESFELGRVVKEGLSILLVGPPNVGKSSLLNRFLGEEKAIVTSQEGTTRDPVEGSLRTKNCDLHFFDSAGIRSTCDEVEKIGVKKSFALFEKVDWAFLVCDISTKFDDTELKSLLKSLISKEYLVLLNKTDVTSESEEKKWIDGFLEKTSCARDRVMCVSAHSGEGLDKVKERAVGLIEKQLSDCSMVIANVRHKKEILSFCTQLEKGIELLEEDESPEFILFELNGALKNIYAILGKELDDQVVDKVFKEFCLGK